MSRVKRTRINHKKFMLFMLAVVVIIALLVTAIYNFVSAKNSSENKADSNTPEQDAAEGTAFGGADAGEEAVPGVDEQSAHSDVQDPYASWPDTSTTEDMYPLSSVSDDILVLVNKTHHLTKDYKADDMVSVTHCDESVGNAGTRQMRKTAADAFEELYAAAQEAGYTILMRTGYRSYEYQESLYNSYVKNHGEAEANTYSAKPGQSEHQTGLCCDVGRPGKGLTSFDGTAEAAWIAENSWRYGFILRFPEGKTDITGYIYESWHIRYVGKEVAKIIYENNLTFEEYIEKASANN